MTDPASIEDAILAHLRHPAYTSTKPRQIARMLDLAGEETYPSFKEALRSMLDRGVVKHGPRGGVVVAAPVAEKPKRAVSDNAVQGTYRHNKRGFGFVIPTEPPGAIDVFIPPGKNEGAISGDTVRVRITGRSKREGKDSAEGEVVSIVSRGISRVVGTVAKRGGEWVVLPDGNNLTEPISTPDAAGRYVKPGTKVVVELTTYPAENVRAVGVITEVLGAAGEKDVDLRSVIIGLDLPEHFPDEVRTQASNAVHAFDPETERGRRLDLTNEIVATIDPDDAKDYDDAISLRRVENGFWELGVHIADVSHFVPRGSPLDLEAEKRGNSTYFPGHVIPMLPEVLSNGVCSLQEGVPRLCKSAFIVLDDKAKPIRTSFANTIIQSRTRLRYREAQAILNNAETIPHPNGERTIGDYPTDVVKLLRDMDALAKRIQKRRIAAGQLTLALPKIQLVLDDEGKVVDAVPEDDSFTHTLIEMFMVEANEAVGRLLDVLGVPFLRRIHPEPEAESGEKLRTFATIAGHALPTLVDRFALQGLLAKTKGKPEEFAINMAVLRSLTRAEYSPQRLGHYALASEHYAHFTSPIRRYADLTVHRLLDAWFDASDADFTSEPLPAPSSAAAAKKTPLRDCPTDSDLVALGKAISFTERRSEEAENELRQVKILTLLEGHVGEEYLGVISGLTNFGLFVQLQRWLVDGLIRYENLLDDWWDVDVRGGVIKGKRTGQKLGVGDVVRVVIAAVDVARRQLDLHVLEVVKRGSHRDPGEKPKHSGRKPESGKFQHRSGTDKRASRSKTRDKRKTGGNAARRAPKR